MMKDKITHIKIQAINNQVPILQDEALDFIVNYIKTHDVERILEIGAAVAYSSICLSMTGAHVDTIERDKDAYEQAKKNIAFVNAHVHIVHDDALTYEGFEDTYDLIFIDAAKSKYQKFFEKYEKNLAVNGAIICDNLNFHHLDINDASKQTKKLLEKIDKFKDFLRNHPAFETNFINVGDGLSLSKRRAAK